MAQAFEESQQAYQSGDGARAKALSEEGKAHKREMEALNAQASEWIFKGTHLSLYLYKNLTGCVHSKQRG